MVRFEEFKGKVVTINYNNSDEYVKGILEDVDEQFVKVRGKHTVRYVKVSEIRDIRTDKREVPEI